MGAGRKRVFKSQKDLKITGEPDRSKEKEDSAMGANKVSRIDKDVDGSPVLPSQFIASAPDLPFV